MAFTASIDLPARFKNFKAVRPASGLSSILNQSGERYRIGRISRCGDACCERCYAKKCTVTDGRVIGKGFIRKPPKRLDYLLRYTRDIPLAVVEAKAAYKAAAD